MYYSAFNGEPRLQRAHGTNSLLARRLLEAHFVQSLLPSACAHSSDKPCQTVSLFEIPDMKAEYLSLLLLFIIQVNPRHARGT
jgi:hypothetical protein